MNHRLLLGILLFLAIYLCQYLQAKQLKIALNSSHFLLVDGKDLKSGFDRYCGCIFVISANIAIVFNVCKIELGWTI